MSRRMRGKPRRPTVLDGTPMPSRSAAWRALKTPYANRMRAYIASGRVVLGDPVRDPDGQAGTRARILAAADEIADPSANRGWAATPLRIRRLGLIKALHHYRTRFGVGVLEEVDA